MIERIDKVEYIANMCNLGIAKALNIGCEIAITNKYTWVLTMDQDSKFEEKMICNYINKFNNMIKDNKNIAIFAPKTLDNEVCGYVSQVITSGNLLNLNVYQTVNRFDNDLFIDEVDHDFCFRLINQNYKIYKFEDIKLNHKLGDKRKIRIFNKQLCAMNHNYIRKYYIVRNRCVIEKRYPKYTSNYLKENILDIIKVILVEDDKYRKLKYMVKGYIDYKKNNLGKLD